MLKFLTTAGVLMLWAVPSQGATLTSYGFNSSVSPSTTASNITASNASYSNLSVAYSSDGYEGTKSAQFAADDVADDSTITGDHISFSLTPDPDYQLFLSDVTWQFKARSLNLTSGYTTRTILYASTDNFLTTLATSAAFVSVADIDSAAPWQMGSLDLSAFGPFDQAVQFRLVAWDFSTLSSKVVRIDDIRINGTVIAPEPDASSVLGVALVALGAVSRRRKRRLAAGC